MTHSIQLCCSQHVHQGIVVCMNVESQSTEVLVELLDHSPLKGKKLQFVGWVKGHSLGQAPASIGDDGIGSITPGVVEDSPKARPTCVSVQLEGPCKLA